MQWWLIAVAALVAAVMLLQSVGPEAAGVLVVLTAAGILAGRRYRARNPPKPPTVYCMKCGEALSATARGCKYCGSASWTLRQ
jgi:hypothetical protein